MEKVIRPFTDFLWNPRARAVGELHDANSRSPCRVVERYVFHSFKLLLFCWSSLIAAQLREVVLPAFQRLRPLGGWRSSFQI